MGSGHVSRFSNTYENSYLCDLAIVKLLFLSCAVCLRMSSTAPAGFIQVEKKQTEGMKVHKNDILDDIQVPTLSVISVHYSL